MLRTFYNTSQGAAFKHSLCWTPLPQAGTPTWTNWGGGGNCKVKLGFDMWDCRASGNYLSILSSLLGDIWVTVMNSFFSILHLSLNVCTQIFALSPSLIERPPPPIWKLWWLDPYLSIFSSLLRDIWVTVMSNFFSILHRSLNTFLSFGHVMKFPFPSSSAKRNGTNVKKHGLI